VRHIGVASDTSLNAVVRASVGEGFMAILKADQEREFPLIFRRGELLEKNCKEISPFVMIVSWRRNSSFWLPQFPKIILSSQERCARSNQRNDLTVSRSTIGRTGLTALLNP
jgi:hypothetical protein